MNISFAIWKQSLVNCYSYYKLPSGHLGRYTYQQRTLDGVEVRPLGAAPNLSSPFTLLYYLRNPIVGRCFLFTLFVTISSILSPFQSTKQTMPGRHEQSIPIDYYEGGELSNSSTYVLPCVKADDEWSETKRSP